MLSPKIRSKVYSLWTKFWSSGMTNPLTSIEQITYLIFLKQLEILDAERIENGLHSIYSSRDFGNEKCKLPHHGDDNYDKDNEICHGHASCKWSVIKEKGSPIHLRDIVFPWLRELDTTLKKLSGESDELLSTTRYMEDAFFQLPKEKERTLQAAIKTIDELFQDVGSRSANADLMGDIFEHMLERIQSSGQNGQFRTPRHIIRFLINLLKPELGSKILDPAVGTAGFLVNSIQYLREQLTPPEQIVYEWNGTPHRLKNPTQEEIQQYFTGQNFVGYDMDRTMVRIGWMNLILHGVENPKIERRDALSQSLPDEESISYDYILANPPYSGSIDKGDIHRNRFPPNPKNKRITGTDDIEPITDKTELLFIWLILDLLKVGGKAAVIVPEGLLFGSSLAHKALRKELLLEHKMHAVISLPGGVFEPYSGVKTSIIYFEKCEPRTNKTDAPNSEKVWFYEITADGYTLDKKRTEQPNSDNDIWDAQYKYDNETSNPKTYYQPEISPARWRVVDDKVVELFPHLAEREGEILGIDERFPTENNGEPLPANPEEAKVIITKKGTSQLKQMYHDFVGQARADAEEANANKTEKADKRRVVKKAFDEKLKELIRVIKEQREKILEEAYNREGGFGRQAFKISQDEADSYILDLIKKWTSAIVNDESLTGIGGSDTENDWQTEVMDLLKIFAQLDGYDVMLKSSPPLPQEELLETRKGWYAPVRVWVEQEAWENEDGSIKGSHDANGKVRPEYITAQFDEDKEELNTDALDIDCIEANDFNISAGRYKPFELEIDDIEPPAEIIKAIQGLEKEILVGLDSLLTMVQEN
ncbi:MAG: N-6 DNA methylase [Chitinophagales bacterium]